jgi:hypothetical protein
MSVCSQILFFLWNPSILNAKTSAAFLAALAVVLIAGNFLVSEIGSKAAVGTGEAAAVRTSGTAQSAAHVFDFKARLDAHRISVAAAVLAREEAIIRKRQERLRKLRPFMNLPAGVSRATLEAIASCESGGDPRIVSSSGLYHGKYQFSPATWEAVGGAGLPSDAPEVEQDYRAALLYVQSGPGQWPVCGF